MLIHVQLQLIIRIHSLYFWTDIVINERASKKKAIFSLTLSLKGEILHELNTYM